MRHPVSDVFTYYGYMDEPTMGVYARTVKTVTRIIDADTYVFEMYDPHAGEDYKVMEITYKRKKQKRAPLPR